ncbi:MAG: hypothetical protein IT462_08885 [Planctomycetes bacterium]|nr:hypothetical protein [Planctomycetota bacterium]
MPILILVALMLMIHAPELGATTAAKLDLDALTDNASVVARGKVKSKEARWDAAKTGIWTRHTVDVSEVARGDARTTLEFVTRGGVVGKVGQAISGCGSFEVGDEYVFFLAQDDDKRLQLVGMVQGAFKIDGKRAKNSYAGLTLVDAKTLKALDKEQSAALEFDVADLLKRVKDRVKRAECRVPSPESKSDKATPKVDDPGPGTRDSEQKAPEKK